MIKTKKHMIKLKNALNCNFECFLTFKKPSNLDYKSTKNLCLNSVLSLRHNLHNFGLGYTLKSKIIKSKLYNSKEKRPIFKSKNTLNNSFGCFLTFEKALNFDSKNSKYSYKSTVSAVLKEKLPLSTIGYPYQQSVTFFNYKTACLSNLTDTRNYSKPCQASNFSQNKTIYICKKLPLSTISYPYQQLVTLFQQLVTLLSTISYASSTFSYAYRSVSSIVATKTIKLLKLLKLIIKISINKRGFLCMNKC